MKQTPINDKWGTIVEFDNPLDVFKQSPGYWRDMMYDRQLIVFKRMKFTKGNYAKLCASFGRLWGENDYLYSHEKTEPVIVKNFKFVISPISNKISGKLGMNEMKWHSDIPNKIDKPFPMRSIWMVNNPHPDSGLTSWLNIEHGIKYLPEELKSQIPNIKIIQQSWWKKDSDVQEHDFIKIHPITKQPSLRLNFFCDDERNINDAWIKSVKVHGEEQIPKPVLGPYLKNLQQQKELVYTHKWDEFDIIIYDNWPFVHNRTKLEFDSELERLMYRTNIDHLSNDDYVAQSRFVETLPNV